MPDLDVGDTVRMTQAFRRSFEGRDNPLFNIGTVFKVEDSLVIVNWQRPYCKGTDIVELPIEWHETNLELIKSGNPRLKLLRKDGVLVLPYEEEIDNIEMKYEKDN